MEALFGAGGDQDTRGGALDQWVRRLRDEDGSLSPHHQEVTHQGVWAEEPLPESEQGPGVEGVENAEADDMQTYVGGYIVVHHCRQRQEYFTLEDWVLCGPSTVEEWADVGVHFHYWRIFPYRNGYDLWGQLEEHRPSCFPSSGRMVDGYDSLRLAGKGPSLQNATKARRRRRRRWWGDYGWWSGGQWKLVYFGDEGNESFEVEVEERKKSAGGGSGTGRVEELAEEYMKVLGEIEEPTPAAWAKVLTAGDALLSGGVVLGSDALDDLQVEQWERCEWAKAGGRRKRESAEERLGKASVKDDAVQQPFDGDVQGRVEDWLEANMTGDKAESTARAYASMWQKWMAWAQRQQWLTLTWTRRTPKLTNARLLGLLGMARCQRCQHETGAVCVEGCSQESRLWGPTTEAFRVWLLVNALDRRAARKPRRLGVTPGMLKVDRSPAFGGRRHERRDQGQCSDASCGTTYSMVLHDEGIWVLWVRTTQQGDDSERGRREVDQRWRRGWERMCEWSYGAVQEDQVGPRSVRLVQDYGQYQDQTALPRGSFGGVPGLWPQPDSKEEKRGYRCSDGRTAQCLKRLEVQEILQRAARAEGLPADRFLSHSLRIGGASALFQVSADVELVKRMGRWSSAAVQRYLHDGGHVLKQLSTKMANVDQRIHYTWEGWRFFGAIPFWECRDLCDGRALHGWGAMKGWGVWRAKYSGKPFLLGHITTCGAQRRHRKKSFRFLGKAHVCAPKVVT